MTNIRKILAVRFGRLGDVILLARALAALKTRLPDAHVALLTDHRYAPIGELCPYIDEVIPVDRLAMRDGGKLAAIVSMARLVRSLQQRGFDLAVDFHGFRESQLLVWLSRSRYRAGLQRLKKAYWRFCFNQAPIPEDKSIHVADMFQRIVDTIAEGDTVPPGAKLLVTDPETGRRVLGDASAANLAAFYVGARAMDHMWPTERFARLADLLVEELGASVLLLSGGSPAEVSMPVRIRSLCRRKESVMIAEIPGTPELVAAIAHCRALVSNDTGPMHIGGAVGVPTLGLFSRGRPEYYRPIGPDGRALRAPDIAEISVEAAFDAFLEIWGVAA